MTIAIHQPNFIPWIGYFYKIQQADIFVLLDDVQYSKNSFINRNKIKSQTIEQWLTIPVLQSGSFGQLINQVNIFNPEQSFTKIKSSLRLNYCKSTFFKEVFELIEPLLDKQNNLAIVNESLIRAIVQYLQISTKIIKSSDLSNISGESTDRLVSICHAIGAKTYLAGFGSKNYQESDKFKSLNIECSISNFKHPEYKQIKGDFIPNLSIIDLLFNTGKEASCFLSK